MANEKIELTNEERTACEVWTRVMGYYRPITAFNKGKRSEYSERMCFKENSCGSEQGCNQKAA